MHPQIATAADRLEIVYERGMPTVIKVNENFFSYDDADEAESTFRSLEADLRRLQCEREAANPLPPWGAEILARERSSREHLQRELVPRQLKSWKLSLKNRRSGQKGGKKSKRDEVKKTLLDALVVEKAMGRTSHQAMTNLACSPFGSLRVEMKSASQKSWVYWDENSHDERKKPLSKKALEKLWAEAGKKRR